MSRAQRLYQLQTVDTQLIESTQILKRIVANIGKSKGLTQAEQRLTEAQTRFRTGQTEAKRLELELKGLTDKIAEQDKLLYSGKVTNTKEVANLQKEVESLKSRRKLLDDHLLTAMVEVEEGENLYDTAQTAYTEAEMKWQEEQSKLTTLKGQYEQKIAELKQKRPAMAKAIEQKDLSEYERLRKKKSGKAVSGVKEDICLGCNVNISQNELLKARSERLSYCGTCGRILHII